MSALSMNRLYKKLSLSLLLLLFSLGFAIFMVSKVTAERYFLEFSQRLNAPIAMYMAGVGNFFNGDQVNIQAFDNLAGHVMVVNPSVEIYLLDARGQILSSAVEASQRQVDNVDMAPVATFLSGQTRFPLLGTDPKNAQENNIFSVHPIMDASTNEVQGYLYAVLAGTVYQNLMATVKGSEILKTSAWVVLLCLCATFFAGLGIFYWLTQRLQHLTQTVAGLRERIDDPAEMDAKQLSLPQSGKHDEVDQLAQVVSAMMQRIQQQYNDLRGHDRERRELIANISHDLRTPLTSMQGYIETLLIKWSELSEQEREQYLQTAHNSGKRLRALVGSLFELAKFDSGQVVLEREVFSLAELLQDIIFDYQLKLDKKNITLHSDIQAPKALVVADIALVQRVFENLLNNAVRHTPNGGDIHIAINAIDDKVEVRIQDNGCGIAEDALTKIFERHYSTGREAGNDAGQLEEQSVGLGLAIVKRILDLHQCSISVTSQLDAGSAFTFELPMKAA